MVCSNRSQALVSAPNIIEGTTMDHYGGIDVSLESSSLYIVDATGRVVREAKISSDPDALTTWLKGLGNAGSRSCGSVLRQDRCRNGFMPE
jgi:hypothetical protein